MPSPLKTDLPTAKLNPDFKTRILNHLLRLSSLGKERKKINIKLQNSLAYKKQGFNF